MRTLILLALIALAATAAERFRLYLKDGTHHTVREYKVDGDRVRYYSSERDDWEELPVDLCDLKKTESERSARVEKQKAEEIEQAAEDKAERDMAREIRRIPKEAGVYWIQESGLTTLKQADIKLVTDKKRQALKMITQMPLNGKSTIELDGAEAALTIADSRPEFYFRMQQDERLAIVRLEPKKGGTRIVGRVSVIPVEKIYLEEFDIIETFRRQVAEQLFRIWPTQPLPPGNYAVIEYTEGKADPQVWDFRIVR